MKSMLDKMTLGAKLLLGPAFTLLLLSAVVVYAIQGLSHQSRELREVAAASQQRMVKANTVMTTLQRAQATGFNVLAMINATMPEAQVNKGIASASADVKAALALLAELETLSADPSVIKAQIAEIKAAQKKMDDALFIADTDTSISTVILLKERARWDKILAELGKYNDAQVSDSTTTISNGVLVSHGSSPSCVHAGPEQLRYEPRQLHWPRRVGVARRRQEVRLGDGHVLRR